MSAPVRSRGDLRPQVVVFLVSFLVSAVVVGAFLGFTMKYFMMMGN